MFENDATNSLEQGMDLHQCMQDLFPLHRSQTGAGVRDSLQILNKIVPLQIHEVSSGTRVFDWQVPLEWKIRDAYIADANGERIVDYRVSNLQVLSHSQAVDRHITSGELQSYLHKLPDQHPCHAIPYRTAFFRETWGFAVSHEQYRRLVNLDDEIFHVVIDSECFPGSLTYGEASWDGLRPETILIHTHCCHPSLANDNLSGMAVAAFLGKWIQERVQAGEILEKSIRIVFAPATIGALVWLSKNQHQLSRIQGGLVLSMLSDAGPFTYKRSRQGQCSTDRAVLACAPTNKVPTQIIGFSPFGYDERQFCSPGFNLPMGCLMRSPPERFPEYHTSLDNMERINPVDLHNSLSMVKEIVWTLEHNSRPLNRYPNGEPQLGKRGLYQGFRHSLDQETLQQAVLWLLNLADGSNDLLAIQEQCQLPFRTLVLAEQLLRQHHLIGDHDHLPIGRKQTHAT